MYPLRLLALTALVTACVNLPGAGAQQVVPLWSGGAPGYESRRDEPEKAGEFWLYNIHNPSLVIYRPPAGQANGAAVVICPGGSHSGLVFDAEGAEPAAYFNRIGVTAFVLKYRLAREKGSVYSLDKEVRADARRAMRLVRSRAAEWGVDPARIGMMGWSAGGEVVALAVYGETGGNARAADPVERASGRPNFQILIYPSPGFLPKHVPAGTPPLFLALADDDDSIPHETGPEFIARYQAAGVPVEAHLYARGQHGFQMGTRSKYVSIRNWSQRLTEWLQDRSLLTPRRP